MIDEILDSLQNTLARINEVSKQILETLEKQQQQANQSYEKYMEALK